MATSAATIGTRIRHWRRRTGRSQAAIAGLCGITEGYLSQIERGRKIPALDVLLAIARELGVPIAALLEEHTHAPTRTTPTTAPDVAAILMGYRTPPPTPGAVTPAALRDRVEAAWRTWQTSRTRYTDAAHILPTLLADVETALQASNADSPTKRDILRTAADLYGLLRSYCRRTGRHDLSLLVADRALRAAQDADDPLRIAAAQWNLGHVLLGTEPEGAEQVATLAAEQLATAPPTLQTRALAGALGLVTVTAAAQRRDWWTARKRLEDLERHATTLGEGNVGWTVFGPTNVELHGLSIDMLAGQAADGLRRADHVDITLVPSRERQFTFTLEVACCYDLRREDAAVLVHLLDLEQIAPEDIARNPQARQLVVRLRSRVRPTYRRQIEALADRIGLDQPPDQ